VDLARFAGGGETPAEVGDGAEGGAGGEEVVPVGRYQSVVLIMIKTVVYVTLPLKGVWRGKTLNVGILQLL